MFDNLSELNDYELATRINNIRNKINVSHYMSGRTPYYEQALSLLAVLEQEQYDRQYRMSYNVQYQDMPVIIEFDPELREEQFRKIAENRKGRIKTQMGVKRNRPNRRRAGPDTLNEIVHTQQIKSEDIGPNSNIITDTVIDIKNTDNDGIITPSLEKIVVKKMPMGNNRRRRADQFEE